MAQKEFDWEVFLASDNNIAVHCSTEEQAIDFCKKMHEHGLKWRGGQSYLELTYWRAHKKETVYGSDRRYADSECYTDKNYIILEWSDYTVSIGVGK